MLWFFIAGLLLLAVAILVMPLFRTQDESSDNRREQNIQIVREQMAELESSFERAEVESDQYHARRAELEQALYLDVDVDGAAEQVRNKTSTTSRVSAGFVLLFVPMAALALYLASDDARYVTGHTLVVDAGQTTAGMTPQRFNLGSSRQFHEAGRVT